MKSKTKLKLAYFGSPDFSALFLEKILTDPDLKKVIDVKLVVTQPDRPAGRKQILTETPVKTVAKKYHLEIFEIENLELFKNLKLKIKNFDLCLVYAFSQIIPKELLKVPKLGFWNLHPSLLPKYRGPSPIAYALIFGEKETGVTIIKMDEKIDHGPIIAQEKLKIEDTDRRPDLEKKLTDLGFNLFKKTVFNKDSLYIERYKEQNHKYATYSRLLKKQDGFIPLSVLKKALKNEPLKFEELPEILKEIENCKLKIVNSSKIVIDYFRGLYPWPGLWTLLRQDFAGQPQEKRLKINEMKYDVLGCKLQITKVQLEGKKEVDFERFNRAYRIF